MKHIKKRFLLESDSEKLKFDDKRFEIINLSQEVSTDVLKNKKDNIAFIETEKGFIYGGFVHKIEGKNMVFPMPDPTLIYFHNAQISIRNIKDARKKLIDKVDFTKSLNESAINEIYNYYGLTSGFVIFLFTSIESFINQLIPEDIVYKNELSKKTEVYNKVQIQEYLDFKTKITKVLKQATNKDFFLKQSSANQLIWNLKDFRDDIVHTKPEENPLQYQKLIKTSLNFKYDKALAAIATFMNYYKPNYIEECGCGSDF